MPVIEREPVVINTFRSPTRLYPALPVATTNPDKIREYQAAGIEVLPIEVTVLELQGESTRKVAEAKAKEAWRLAGRPVLIEDASLHIPAWQTHVPAHTRYSLGTRAQREEACRILGTLYPDKRDATFQVLLTLYDGRRFQTREGLTQGTITNQPVGPDLFGFDDIFTSEGETAPYSLMTLDQKNQTSARQRALTALKKNPFEVGNYIYALPEPPIDQIRRLRKEELAANLAALHFAYSMEATKHLVPNPDLRVDNFQPFHRIERADGAVVQYKIDPNSADQGVVINRSIDLKRDPRGRPRRLDVDIAEEPILVQMGPQQVEMALASRALEFMEMHSDETHKLIRDLRDGKIAHVPRSNTPDLALEIALGMRDNAGNSTGQVTHAVATSELGYNGESSLDRNRSRRKSRKSGIFINTEFGPMSILGLGGMPPTTGSKDMLVLSAMSYGQCWIPRNGIYADNFDLQLQLFKETKNQIKSYGLPKDIEELCISKIGLSVGCEDPEEIAKEVAEYYKEGGRSARIYTTNGDARVLETAKAIRKATDELNGENGDKFMLAVGPIVDAKEAVRLKEEADVNMFILGQGLGENCSTLADGGAANQLALLYELYLNSYMNDRLLILEGGVGEQYGPLLGLCDGFSMNKKALGGIESTAGLYVSYKDGTPCLPYHGSAGPGNTLTEAYAREDLTTRRLNAAGKLETNEGKPNYYVKPDWVHSSTDALRRQREMVGRALANRATDSLYELRNNIRERGNHNIVYVTASANTAAKPHRAIIEG